MNAIGRRFLLFLSPDLGRALDGPVKQPACGPGGKTSKEGSNVNRYALATALALTVGGAAQAAVIDLTSAVEAARTQPAVTHSAAIDQPALPRIQVLAARTSELPEPEVFAMMLLGLVLIGYRASRDSTEKFK